MIDVDSERADRVHGLALRRMRHRWIGLQPSGEAHALRGAKRTGQREPDAVLRLAVRAEFEPRALRRQGHGQVVPGQRYAVEPDADVDRGPGQFDRVRDAEVDVDRSVRWMEGEPRMLGRQRPRQPLQRSAQAVVDGETLRRDREVEVSVPVPRQERRHVDRVRLHDAVRAEDARTRVAGQLAERDLDRAQTRGVARVDESPVTFSSGNGNPWLCCAVAAGA